MIEDFSDQDEARGAIERGEQHERDRATIAALRQQIADGARETQHLIRNILSVIRSIARRTVEDGESAEDYQARLESRLASFANLQSRILVAPERGVDLCTLVDNELLAFGIKLGDQGHALGDPIRLKSKPASILGLAFHELARMAIEGGASAGLDGQIEISWRITRKGSEREQLEIVWLETGRQAYGGATPDPAFGREVVEEAVAYEVGGDAQLDITGDGLRCRFSLPAEQIVADAGEAAPAADD